MMEMKMIMLRRVMLLYQQEAERDDSASSETEDTFSSGRAQWNMRRQFSKNGSALGLLVFPAHVKRKHVIRRSDEGIISCNLMKSEMAKLVEKMCKIVHLFYVVPGVCLLCSLQ